MSNRQTITRKKKDFPGLNLTIPAEEKVLIEHNGEHLQLVIVGHAGRFYTVVFEGSKSFRIERESRGLKDDQ